MSAFATVERRRREELLAIQKQDREQQQLTTLGLIYNETARGRGRSSIVWAKVPKSADEGV